MKKLINNIKQFLKSCHICHGMGNTEKPNGDTVECISCKGKGYL